MLIPNLLSIWSIDKELFRSIHVGMQRDFLDPIMLIIGYTGDGHIQIPILLFLAINKKTRTVGLALISSFLFAGGLRLLLKDLVSRPRPSNFEWSEPLTWPGGFPGGSEGWLGKTFDVIPYGNSSFPSGHSTTSFAIAIMLAWLVYKSEYSWLGWAACVWATLVGISRVYVGVHYPGDVLGAAALAAITATILYTLWNSKGWIPFTPLVAEEMKESESI